MKYLLVVLLLAGNNAYAALNKWVDSEGKVHYSDEQPPANTKAQTIRNAPASTTPASGPAPAKTIFEQEADLRKAQKAKEEAAQKAAKQEEEAKAKKSNCESAKNNLATLQNTLRVITYDQSGQRNMMDESTRQQKIDESQAAVSKYCN